MLDENRTEDLMLFYQLLARVHHGLKELCTSFAAYIKVHEHVLCGWIRADVVHETWVIRD